MQWKAVLIADKQHADFVKKGVQSLGRAGFEEVHIFIPHGVKVPLADHVIRHRSEATNPLELWKDAIESMSHLASSTDLYLLTTPDLEFWEHFRVFIEATIEPDFCGIYLPYTPAVLWRDHTNRPLPCSGELGWCEQPVEAMTEADCCLVMNNRTLPLLAHYLSQRIWGMPDWSVVFSECVGRTHRLPVFFAKSSLAKRVESGDTLEVQNVQLSPEQLQATNFYLGE